MLTTSGQVHCWGRDGEGQVGDGAADTTDQGTRFTIPDFAEGLDLALGWSTTCVVTDDGRWLCWGENLTGPCGLGHEGDQHVPAFVSFGAGAAL